MNYLALDQASRITGWAVFDENKEIKAFGKFSVAAHKTMQERLNDFVNDLEVIITTFNPSKIFYEGIQYQNNAETYKKLAFIMAMIIYVSNVLNIEIQEMPPSHWRSILKDKFNVNFGRTRTEQKKQSQEFVKNHFNIIESEDTCDAICLGYAGLIENDKYKSAF